MAAGVQHMSLRHGQHPRPALWRQSRAALQVIRCSALCWQLHRAGTQRQRHRGTHWDHKTVLIFDAKAILTRDISRIWWLLEKEKDGTERHAAKPLRRGVSLIMLLLLTLLINNNNTKSNDKVTQRGNYPVVALFFLPWNQIETSR